ncbi:MAG: TasA family protein, partial [Methanosarcinaceae archaeon]|nr:TasA family protein [Methanosarcinaceae archaeon]
MLNKKMLLSLLIIGVVSVSAGAGTWAYFTDTETSTGNTFTAGTLDLIVNGVDITTERFEISDVAPGDTGMYPLVVKNEGSIDGTLTISFANLLDLDNGLTE